LVSDGFRKADIGTSGLSKSTPWPPKNGHYALIDFAFALLLKNAAWNTTGAILPMLP